MPESVHGHTRVVPLDGVSSMRHTFDNAAGAWRRRVTQ